MEAIAALEASGMKMAHALDAVTPERGAGHCITSAIVGGAINLYQVGEWATAHVIRHNKQAKQVLGTIGAGARGRGPEARGRRPEARGQGSGIRGQGRVNRPPFVETLALRVPSRSPLP